MNKPNREKLAQLVSEEKEADLDSFLKKTLPFFSEPDNSSSYKPELKLANALKKMGEYKRSQQILEKLLKSDLKDELQRSTVLNNFGALMQDLGDYQHAKKSYEESLQISQSMLNPNHPSIATTMSNLAGVYEALGDNPFALKLYKQSLEVSRQALGPNHPVVASTLNNLAAVYQALGNSHLALKYFEESLNHSRESLGFDHPEVGIILNNLGGLLQAKGDLTSAKSNYEQALTIQRKVLGEDHPNTATSLNNIGRLLEVEGDLTRAKSYFEQALAIRKKVLGEVHPDTASSLNNISGVLQAQGDYAGAKSNLELALTIFRKVLGEEHPHTKVVKKNLESLLKLEFYSNKYKEEKSEQKIHITTEVRAAEDKTAEAKAAENHRTFQENMAMQASSERREREQQARWSRIAEEAGNGRRASSNSGCFPGDTKIMTPNGFTPISKLKMGDLVISFSTKSLCFEPKPIIKITKHHSCRIWMLIFTDQTHLRTTSIHSFLSGGQWVKAQKFKAGQQIRTNQAKFKTIAFSTSTNEIGEVFNLVVSDNFSFIAEGIVAHSFSNFRTTRVLVLKALLWLKKILKSATWGTYVSEEKWTI